MESPTGILDFFLKILILGLWNLPILTKFAIQNLHLFLLFLLDWSEGVVGLSSKSNPQNNIITYSHFSETLAVLISLLLSGTLYSFGCIFPFLLYLSFLFFFSATSKASSDNYLPFLFVGDGLVNISCTVLPISVHSFSGTLSTRSKPLNLFVTFTV